MTARQIYTHTCKMVIDRALNLYEAERQALSPFGHNDKKKKNNQTKLYEQHRSTSER